LFDLRSLENCEFTAHFLPDEPIAIEPSLTHVWFCDLDQRQQIKEDWRSMLSTEEVARVMRLKGTVERRRSVNRFVFVRQVLGNLAGIMPEKLKYYCGDSGKPELACFGVVNGEQPAMLHFNIAHTENVLAMAVSLGHKVGIDIEVVMSDLDFFEIAKTCCAKEDLEILYSLPKNKVPAAFYRLWTCKEAIAKMDGCGITYGFTKLSTDLTYALYSFEFDLDEKKIIGALTLESNFDPKISSSEKIR
jgi:4'-phosphopantetheinyl transferase